MRRIKAATVRQVIVRLHRRVGLAVSAFLVLAGLTGSALTFREELGMARPRTACGRFSSGHWLCNTAGRVPAERTG
jgi:hypothetical protein